MLRCRLDPTNTRADKCDAYENFLRNLDEFKKFGVLPEIVPFSDDDIDTIFLNKAV